MSAREERLQCPKGLHADWLPDSKHGRTCPWCLIGMQAAAMTSMRHELESYRAWERNFEANHRSDQSQAAVANLRIAELNIERDRLKDRVAELETTLKKYVGVEPTVAEELAYVSRCLFAVYAVCDAAEKQATRWENPLPVPEWVAMVRNAADGVVDAAPALPPVPQQRQPEDPHASELHHDYALGRDLPAFPRQRDGEAL